MSDKADQYIFSCKGCKTVLGVTTATELTLEAARVLHRLNVICLICGQVNFWHPSPVVPTEKITDARTRPVIR